MNNWYICENLYAMHMWKYVNVEKSVFFELLIYMWKSEWNACVKIYMLKATEN